MRPVRFGEGCLGRGLCPLPRNLIFKLNGIWTKSPDCSRLIESSIAFLITEPSSYLVDCEMTVLDDNVSDY